MDATQPLRSNVAALGASKRHINLAHAATPGHGNAGPIVNYASANSSDAPTTGHRNSIWSLPPSGIAAVYLVAGVLWVLLSDRLAQVLIPDLETLSWVQTYKGWVFIALTTLLIYALIRRTVLAVELAERAKAESELKFRTLVEQIPAVTYIAVPHGGGTTYMSPQAGPLLGYAPEEWNSTPDMWHRLLYPADHDRVAQELEETYRTGKPFKAEYRMQARDGSTYWFHDEATLLRDEAGSPVRLQGVMTDITQRKADEQQLKEQAASQERLLGELVRAQEAERHRLSLEIHDGPLQSLGAALLALDRAMRREERGEVEQARAELGTLRATLESTVAEVRSVLADLSLDVLHENGLIPALNEHVQRFSELTGVEVRLDEDLKERLPPQVELLAYRVVQEALANVRKHARATRLDVKIRTEAGRLVMSITDNGRGFDVDGVRSNILPGERLGLRSMQERVQNAGGEFSILSGPDQGTTITFVVPYREG